MGWGLNHSAAREQSGRLFYSGHSLIASVKPSGTFTLRPGNHEIELRGSDGQIVYQEKVAVTVGKTTKLQIS